MDFTTLLRPSEDFMYGVGLPSVDDHIMRTHIGPSKDEEIFFHTDPLANDFDIPSLPSTVVSAYRSPLLAQGSFDPQGATNERTTSSQFLSASVLVSEIYERTVSLECDPRIPSLSGAEERSDRYSVGPVLELTRRLAAELRHSWRPKVAVQDIQQLRPSTSTYPVSPESMDILSVQQASSEVVDSKSISTEMPDLATTMLMLTGYASLMKLYMVVFSQIHNVLEQLPGSASSHHAPSHGLGESEQLQPGELLAPTSTFEGCSSIYITVQLLLDEFQAVEDIVSFDSLHDQDTSSRGKEKNSLEEAQQQKLPGAELNSHEGWLTRQLEIIRAGLKKDMIRILGNGSQRELTSILQHGHYLKVLLRERMGL
ncbi:hypothetical protein AbraIFM66951_002846 [Aspergillus brasiliensis]|uniref:Aflatoxin regulatory protein domain-containing protein n=1 Tax=Aspergillus brasiliensis TaxID=319629 RepID=A0A9W5YYG0_9EURO|nr:hypothetical protein AbraCBS73388_001656 [Aspergillus brasiliensis]GKZ50001.1 hypothetical protein AbraIFM66951_002846 [Aspergillus brasiliensis]